MALIIPEHYHLKLLPETTEVAIKLIKEAFQERLSRALRLRRVTAPLFVLSGTGLNDDLNGVESPVGFDLVCMSTATKCSIQIYSIRLYVKCFNCLI